MRTYQLDLLDEKALVILQGLEQLRIITLRPISDDAISLVDGDLKNPANNLAISESENNQLSQFKNFQGAIKTGLTLEGIDNNIDKMRDGWL